MAFITQQSDHKKRDMNYVLNIKGYELNKKTYIFLLLKTLSNSVCVSSMQ